jgi:hypothetical protein
MIQRHPRILLIAALSGIIVWASLLCAQPSAPSASQQIQLLISLKQPFVAEPEAARIVLHIHNSSSQTLWLYRRAKGKHPPEEIIQEENRALKTSGGSSVEVRLLPADAKTAQAVVTGAEARVLEYVEMPKPRLIKLAAGADYEETSIVHLQPAMAEGQKPIWGKYQLTAIYSASFSNGELFPRSLGENLWQGEVASNSIAIDLRSPLPDSVGRLDGTAVGQDLQPRAGIRVSLSDAQGEVMDQQVTEADGRFSFDQLPMALYWVTGRREDAPQDTVTFHHQELASSAPQASVQLSFFPVEIEDPKKYVHKPVLVKVFDAGRQPLRKVALDAIFSDGQVVDNLKAVTSDDGTVVMELIPGRVSLSLKQHGCQEQVERADVSPGGGVDGFRYVLDCVRK